MFVGPFSDGATQETGMAFMQNIDDTVIVNVFSTFSNFVATRRADSDLFGYRLIALWAKFHILFSKCWWLQTIGPARPMGRGGLKRLEEILHSISNGSDNRIYNIRRFASGGGAEPISRTLNSYLCIFISL
jgi:hypothetical protein